MIEKVLPFQFIKKSPLYGSYQGMNYRITEMKGMLEVCTYPGPYAFWYTPEEKKTYREFAFTEEGYEEALEYLNRVYEATDWEKEQVPF